MDLQHWEAQFDCFVERIALIADSVGGGLQFMVNPSVAPGIALEIADHGGLTDLLDIAALVEIANHFRVRLEGATVSILGFADVHASQRLLLEDAPFVEQRSRVRCRRRWSNNANHCGKGKRAASKHGCGLCGLTISVYMPRHSACKRLGLESRQINHVGLNRRCKRSC